MNTDLTLSIIFVVVAVLAVILAFLIAYIRKRRHDFARVDSEMATVVTIDAPEAQVRDRGLVSVELKAVEMF